MSNILNKLIKKALKETDDAAMKKSAKGMAMYGKKSKMKEAEVTAGAENTKFNLKIDVSNPQSETKLGVRIQLEPKEGFLEPEIKDNLETALMKKLNNALEQFDIQISKDTDVPDPTIIGFFIPLSQIKNMIVKSIKGPSTPTTPTTPPVSKPSTPSPKPTEPIDESIDTKSSSPTSTKEVLESQMQQSMKASQEALASGSYQAFAALQRQVVSIAMQLQNLDAVSNGDAFEQQSDEDVLEQISSIILALPPVLRQRLTSDIIGLMNVEKSGTVIEA